MEDLKQGLYFVYGEVALEKGYLSVISWDGTYQGRLAEVLGGYGSALSPDKHHLVDLPYIIDLNSGERSFYEELESCTAPSWSPDSTKLAVSCPTDNFHHDDIYIFSLGDLSKVPITNCEFEAFSCGGPLWSPDGHWLAFYRGLAGSGTSRLVGLHILDMTCSSGLVECWKDEEGIYVPADFSWSPDSEFLAAVDKNKVFVFETKGGKLELTESYTIDGSLAQVTWLDDSDKLLVLDNKGGGGYMISKQTGAISPVMEPLNRFLKSHTGSISFAFAIP